MTKQGLYDPSQEHAACGVGLVASVKGEKSHRIIEQGIEVLINLGHRGAAGADPKTGEAYSNLAVVYLQTGRFDEAEKAVKAAEKTGFKVNPMLKDDIKAKKKAGQ